MKRSLPTTPRWRVIAVAVPLALAACGGGDAGDFDASVDGVRDAIQRGDRAEAMANLESLAVEGLAAHDAGDLSDAELDELARLIEASRQQVDALMPTTTTTTTTTAPPPPVDDDNDDEREDDEDKDDKGKKKGHDD